MPKKDESKLILFAREYVIDFNGTRAALAVGCPEASAHVQASRWLRNDKVMAEIDKLTAKRGEKLEITADYVLQTIRDTVERCGQAVEVKDNKGIPTGVYRFEAIAVLKGCELLGKYKKLWTDKVENVDSEGKPLRTVKVLLMGKGI